MPHTDRTGIWMIGARGSIGTTVIAAVKLLARRLVPDIGLVTSRTEFSEIDLVPPKNMVIGGHEIGDTPLIETARRLWSDGHLGGEIDAVADDIIEVERNLRPGARANSESSDVSTVRRLRDDFDRFKTENNLSRLVIVNVATTEPRGSGIETYQSYDNLRRICDTASLLPASSLYAWAAFEGGDAFIDFTPCRSFRAPALLDLAERRGALYMGSDGKTGETLMKSVLVELFRRRHLKVRSWFGQNILGNMDGRSLTFPDRKSAKVESKRRTVLSALGEDVDAQIGIDYVESLGEWKVAWDYIHFTGFLGCDMNLQCTWTGNDSALAAPLVIDLVRLTDLAMRRGMTGPMVFLSQFFKDPFRGDSLSLVEQDEVLLRWVREMT